MGRLWRWFRSRSTRVQAGSWIALALVVVLAAGFGGAATDPVTDTTTITDTVPAPATATGTTPTVTTETTAAAPAAPTATEAPPATPAPTAPAPPAPAPTATTPTPTALATGTARAALARLAVKGRAPKTGYSRDRFGGGWATQAGCVTRDRILRRDLTRKTFVSRSSCRIATGMLHDPYTGKTLRFVRGRSGNIDIDHVVSLGDAWQKGAQQWTPAKRKRFANDPLDLLAVGASVNRAKGDADAATWLPPRKAFRCQFIARQVAVKRTYGLWVTRAERDAMARVLATCPNQRLPAGTPAAPITTPPATPAPPRPAPAPTTPSPRPTTPAPTGTGPSGLPIVHPGAFCSARGARGKTSSGTAMVCRTTPDDSRLRWRRP